MWTSLFYHAGATLHAAHLATVYAPLVQCAKAGRRIKIRSDGRWEFGEKDVWPADVHPSHVAVVLATLGGLR